MVNAYRWSPNTSASSDLAAIASRREAREDVASVAQMWVSAAYDDLRRSGPDRGIRVRGVLDRYVIPWFGPQTSTVGDITYLMVHEWLLTLVGRQPSRVMDCPPGPEDVVGSRPEGGLSLREAA